MVAKRKTDEPLGNVVPVCEGHAPRPRPELYAGRPLESFVGKHVKLGFPTRSRPVSAADWPDTEHMWVKVEMVGLKNVLVGRLNNDPHFCHKELFDGAKVEFTADEIEMVYGEPEVRG